jgi:AcrR family transcriptional regulator
MSRQDDIREEALAIICEGGIRSLTLPALFERVHTGAGTFYHYYKDRDDLIDSIFEHAYNIAEAAFDGIGETDGSVYTRFEELCTAICEAYKKYPRELNFLYWYEYGYIAPEKAGERVIPSIRHLSAVIADGQAEGIVRIDATPNMIARVVRGMAASLFWGYERGEYELSPAAITRFAQSAWRAIEVF